MLLHGFQHLLRYFLKRIGEDGRSALVQTNEPVKKFPDFAGYIVRRLKILSLSLGNKRMAQLLARAGRPGCRLNNVV